MRDNRFFVLAGLGLVLSGPGIAQTLPATIYDRSAEEAAFPSLEDAMTAYRAGDYERALYIWTEYGNGAHGAAAYNVGLMHERGLGTPKSPTEAYNWYVKAAGFGDVDGSYKAGMMNLEGVGTNRSEPIAIYYFTQAAARGKPEAMHGMMMAASDLYWTDLNYERSFRIFKPLALAGQVDAQYMLARHYRYGQGVASNLEEAERLYRLAAEAGNPFAAYELGSDIEVQGKYGEAMRLYQMAAEAGYAKGYMGLAGLFATGKGVTQDSAQAAMYYQKAADLGDDVAAMMAGIERSHARLAREASQREAAEQRTRDRHRAAIQRAEAAQRTETDVAYSGGPELSGWRGWLVGFAGGGSTSGYTASGSDGSYTGGASRSGFNDPYGGLNPWSSEYQTRQAISNPISYFQNSYNY